MLPEQLKGPGRDPQFLTSTTGLMAKNAGRDQRVTTPVNTLTPKRAGAKS